MTVVFGTSGNAYVAKKNYESAISCFDMALKTLPKDDEEDIYVANRATAHCKIGQLTYPHSVVFGTYQRRGSVMGAFNMKALFVSEEGDQKYTKRVLLTAAKRKKDKAQKRWRVGYTNSKLKTMTRGTNNARVQGTRNPKNTECAKDHYLGCTLQDRLKCLGKVTQKQV